MLPIELIKRLEGIRDASKKGYPIRNLYRLMYEEALWVQAYANIQSNKGALTKGVDDNTLDGFSRKRVSELIRSLAEKTYEPKPVRREYVPKSNGKMRPLGIPCGDDKLMQEVARIILEEAYEPVFSDHSHGFRKGRSCHTALSEITRCWAGTKWLIDVDIKGYFDNIDHEKLLELLGKKVGDHRFTHLIKQWLQAGYVDKWEYHRTYSGTPQGGIISPLLANIYLHELDRYLEELKRTFDTGKERKQNPEYQRIAKQLMKCRREIDAIKDDPTRKAELVGLRQEMDRLTERQRSIPKHIMSDPGFKRLNFVRYADDFMIGIIGSKEDAEAVMQKVKDFLANELKLETSEDKTKIRHIEEGSRFLGYEVRSGAGDKEMYRVVKGRLCKQRTSVGVVSLYVPSDVGHKFCQDHAYGDYMSSRSESRRYLTILSEPEIIATYNAELQGLAQYYALAKDVKYTLHKVFFMAQYSLYKTLALKRKTHSSAKVMRSMRSGDEYVIRYENGGGPREIKVYQLRHLVRKGRDWQVDLKPRTEKFKFTRTELIRRLNANKCELCGKEGDCEVHHVRKLKDLVHKHNKTLVDRMMIARKRKTMVLCEECHDRLHAGTLPDLRLPG